MRNTYVMHKAPSLITPLFLMVWLGFGLSACGQKPSAGKDAVVIPPSPFAAIANGKADVEGGVIEVAARRAGVLAEVMVNEGDRVVRGQILARQESDQPRLAVLSAEASVKQFQSQMNLTSVNLNAAKREYERLVKLAPDNFVATQRLDQAKDTIHQFEAQLQAEQAAVDISRARLAEARYDLEMTVIRAPVNGKILRRYANPGGGASTLNVSNMFDIEPDALRIIRSEIVESSIPDVRVGQAVEIVPEVDQTKLYVGTVIRIAGTFGARKLKSDGNTEASDERVVEVVVAADKTPFLIGQRVLVKFMKPGEMAGVKRAVPVTPNKS
jgi:multidrug resistance efflux pump